MGILFVMGILFTLTPSCQGKVIQSESYHIILDNGYVKVSFDKTTSSIDMVSADFSGKGSFTKNVLAKPFSLEVSTTDSCPLNWSPKQAEVRWVKKSDQVGSFQVEVSDCTALVNERWTITLEDQSRKVILRFQGEISRSTQARVLHGMYFNSVSGFGLFDHGLVQMMGNNMKCMGSDASLPRAYFLGEGVSMDVLRGVVETNGPKQVVMMSKGDGFGSGLQDVVIGTYPNLSRDYKTAWSLCWGVNAATAGRVDVSAGTQWDYSTTWLPNDFDFPVHTLADPSKDPSLPFLDIQTFMTGIYASPAGCLQSYYNKQTGIIAPTVSHPDYGYSPNTNFFDPDNFIALSALMYSGDVYLLGQVRDVLERTAETICGIGSNAVSSYCSQPRQRLAHKFNHLPRFASRLKAESARAGQIMHHFINLVPTYESIAGSEQLGPNVFWTMCVMRYIEITQDTAWAEKMFPYVDLSTQFLTTFFDPSMDMINAPGPLWIDVIVRENYASDSNAMLVPLFRKIADLYEYLEKDASLPLQLREMSDRITVAMNKHLWVQGLPAKSKTGDEGVIDHYVTQLNGDGSTRDFVDYDSNLIAVAFGVASDEQSRRIFARIDSSEHAHVRGTWCSEVAYTGDRCDCYIVGGSYCGDSIVTLARIGWVDSLARKRMGDRTTFDELLLKPLQKDLVDNVWLYERYDANSTQIRTPFYFEYPSLVAMMLREVRYGISIGLKEVEIAPMTLEPFYYAFGDVEVRYSQTRVEMKLPGDETVSKSKSVIVRGLVRGGLYSVSDGCVGVVRGWHGSTQSDVRADADGGVTIDAAFASTCSLVITQKNA